MPKYVPMLEGIMHSSSGRALCLLTLGHVSAYNMDNTILFYKQMFVILYASTRKKIQQIYLSNRRRGFWALVFNATFNNISVILWRSVLLVDESDYIRCCVSFDITVDVYHLLAVNRQFSPIISSKITDYHHTTQVAIASQSECFQFIFQYIWITFRKCRAY